MDPSGLLPIDDAQRPAARRLQVSGYELTNLTANDALQIVLTAHLVHNLKLY
jgi:hypothetical protein